METIKENTEIKKYKIFMVGNSRGYASWFPLPFEFTNNPEKADIAWWIGGADVDPAIYGEKTGSRTYVDKNASEYELEMWNYFGNKNNVLKIGVCKGSQNLCCFNGGKMVQHSTHPNYHCISTNDGQILSCISTHHQQGLLLQEFTGLKENLDYELIAWAENLSPFHLNGKDQYFNFPKDYREPEIFWFPGTKSLCFQSHPEMMKINDPFVKYCQKLVLEKLNCLKKLFLIR